MRNKKFNPFKNLNLDRQEKEIEKVLEKGEYRQTGDSEKIRNIFKSAAKRYTELQKSKSITLRIKKMDLIKLKAKAVKNNIPYQTLIGLLIKSYAENKTKLTL